VKKKLNAELLLSLISLENTNSISVCIASYNGGGKLHQTIEAILQNTVLPNEIVVFLDGSTDNSAAVLKAFDNPIIRIIESENLGRASARNKALEHAKSEIILFLDDDIIIPENTIAEHLNHHKKNDDSVLSCPTITVQSANDFSNFKRYLETKWNTHIDPENETTFSAAFFSISKHIFNTIGGFHSGLNDAEDYEFGMRMKELGIKTHVQHKLVGIHNDPMSCKYFIERNRQYRKANELLIASGILENNKYVVQKPGVIKKFIFFFLASNFWVKLIDKNAFRFLYKPLRYKFYDYVSAGFIYYFPNKRLK